ncbi:MAG TPA: CGNR zinc finger domain-containing protein [Acidimicrobiales bacterium]|jgi:predicted RNA-binding Zn ribbon-like protein
MATDEYNELLVERVRSFVNTYELHEDEDRLRTPADLLGWFEEMDLLDETAPGPPKVTTADLDLAHQLRATLRDLLRSKRDGVPTESHAAHEVEELSAELPLRVVLWSDGQPYLVPAVAGARHALARILAAVAAMAPNNWERLKICAADDCEWVYYDSSRNHSRRWCSMEGCGNRSKVRTYRTRH